MSHDTFGRSRCPTHLHAALQAPRLVPTRPVLHAPETRSPQYVSVQAGARTVRARTVTPRQPPLDARYMRKKSSDTFPGSSESYASQT